MNQIPITKMEFIPCCAIDINQSTADGQGNILKELYKQGNIGHKSDSPGTCDISTHVQLVHGDLHTGELIETTKRSHCIEANAVQCIQYVIFIMGLFHYLMACDNTLWRIFIESKSAQKGPNSLYTHMCAI
jgi:hypothetical protein